jgi:UDP-N-acetylmuramate dehydrogenase
MQPAQRSRLAALLPGTVRERAPLAPYTSFQIGGPAELLLTVETASELAAAMTILRAEAVPWFYLGHGSNILVSDDGFDGVVIRARGELADITLEGGAVQAGPAARLLDLTLFAAAHGLGGMEALSGIPGSVGGGLFMNAGAYGGEIADTVRDVDVLTAEGRVERLPKTAIGFGYRSAPALQDALILSSRYALPPAEKAAIYSEMRRVWKLRRAKQPLDFPSAGSIFKRPPNDFAGRLIEAVDGKGARIGGAMVPLKHAGIFINAGGATAADVTALIRDIRRRVFERFGILLETEVRPVGFAQDPFRIALPR